MRQRLYFILVLTIASCYLFKTYSQINTDSLEKEILKSGLSLAYDIVTKEHGGTIKVESKNGEGGVFVIICQ